MVHSDADGTGKWPTQHIATTIVAPIHCTPCLPFYHHLNSNIFYHHLSSNIRYHHLNSHNKPRHCTLQHPTTTALANKVDLLQSHHCMNHQHQWAPWPINYLLLSDAHRQPYVNSTGSTINSACTTRGWSTQRGIASPRARNAVAGQHPTLYRLHHSIQHRPNHDYTYAPSLHTSFDSTQHRCKPPDFLTAHDLLIDAKSQRLIHHPSGAIIPTKHTRHIIVHTYHYNHPSRQFIGQHPTRIP
ncbi:hypothetical protein Pmani_003690 [Petrolisthes manimaculis]|uniref:Uncharacterized protein n=1 Tax=Petrolisthes manimaculis TaxID=1843537 RepID=A0AAE1QI25_9EUCA|nr:hypothetical protein Pmani_003690 [Petrolisthes manimaculis]